MNLKSRLKTFLTGAAGAAVAVVLIAATPNGVLTTNVIPTVTNVGTTDLFQDVVGGQPAAGRVFATAAQINGVQGYYNMGAFNTTSASYTVGNAVTNVFGYPSGTATLVTLTMPASPGDGQRVCFLSTQTTSTLTFTANTGQTVTNGPTAGVANVPLCMTYVASIATWERSN